jgi:hypothetical protein
VRKIPQLYPRWGPIVAPYALGPPGRKWPEPLRSGLRQLAIAESLAGLPQGDEARQQPVRAPCAISAPPFLVRVPVPLAQAE